MLTGSYTKHIDMLNQLGSIHWDWCIAKEETYKDHKWNMSQHVSFQSKNNIPERKSKNPLGNLWSSWASALMIWIWIWPSQAEVPCWVADLEGKVHRSGISCGRRAKISVAGHIHRAHKPQLTKPIAETPQMSWSIFCSLSSFWLKGSGKLNSSIN